MGGYFDAPPRALTPDDRQGARVLLMGALGVTPYIDRALEVLELAERGTDREYSALVVARDGTVAGLALFGEIGGTAAAAKLHVLAIVPGVIDGDVGARLLAAVAGAARQAGAEFLLAEMPDDPALGTTLDLLRASGFAEEARVPDFYRDGIALAFLRRRL